MGFEINPNTRIYNANIEDNSPYAVKDDATVQIKRLIDTVRDENDGKLNMTNSQEQKLIGLLEKVDVSNKKEFKAAQGLMAKIKWEPQSLFVKQAINFLVVKRRLIDMLPNGSEEIINTDAMNLSKLLCYKGTGYGDPEKVISGLRTNQALLIVLDRLADKFPELGPNIVNQAAYLISIQLPGKADKANKVKDQIFESYLQITDKPRFESRLNPAGKVFIGEIEKQ